MLAAVLAAPAQAAYVNDLKRTAAQQRLADDPEWRNLLHLRHNVWGWPDSGIDDPHFFLNWQGAQDPASELNATLDAFAVPVSSDGATDDHAQCRYPARYRWLKTRLHFDPAQLPELTCPRFQAWHDKMNAESVSLIFASYYMNNPASTYGHTFLRLNRPASDPTSTHHLLDYTVNFAAQPTTNNGILYALYGLAGLFRGTFSTMPYYIKVQQYNNLESRDLWEYSLRLTPAQVDLMVRHLWELGQTSMAYFFFNRNCSYQLMPLLEVADPALRMSADFRFKTIPSDTLRAVRRQPGFAGDGERRPSARSALLAQRTLLSRHEAWLTERLLKPGDHTADLNPLPGDRQALVLDTARDLLRYRSGYAPDQPATVGEKEQQLLLRRSAIDASTVPLPSDPELSVSPDRGHRTGRIAFTQGVSNRSAFQELQLRPALQDLDDSAYGYLPGSQLEMFNTRIRYDDRRKTPYLEELSLVDIVSLPSWDAWVHKPSWKVNAGARVAHELNKDPENSLYFGLNTGPGISLKIASPLRVFAFAEIDGGAGAPWRAGGRFGAGGSAGVLFEFNRYWRVRAQVQQIHYVIGDPDSTTHVEVVPSWSITDRLDLRIHLDQWNRYKEGRLGVYWFL